MLNLSSLLRLFVPFPSAVFTEFRVIALPVFTSFSVVDSRRQENVGIIGQSFVYPTQG